MLRSQSPPPTPLPRSQLRGTEVFSEVPKGIKRLPKTKVRTKQRERKDPTKRWGGDGETLSGEGKAAVNGEGAALELRTGNLRIEPRHPTESGETESRRDSVGLTR